MLNESWLKEYVSNNLILLNYNIFRNHRITRGGGVLIAIKKTYKCNEKQKSNNFENIYVEVLSNNYRILLLTLYRPPNIDINYDEYFYTHFKIVEQNDYDLIIFIGDLNIDFNNHNKYEVKELKQNLILIYAFIEHFN